MKKLNNSFYAIAKKLKDSEVLVKINKLIKDNILLTPVIYIIGTIALLLRNKKYGLQFTNISLLQFAIMVAYIIFFLVIYSLIEYTYINLYELIRSKENKKIIKSIGYILLLILFMLTTFIFMYLITNDVSASIAAIIIYYILWPIVTLIFNKRDNLNFIYTIVVFIYMIINIPMQLGGLKGQEVIYHEYNNGEKNEYTYYGNYEDLYQFTSEDRVFLIPIDSGYIEYKK